MERHLLCHDIRRTLADIQRLAVVAWKRYHELTDIGGVGGYIRYMDDTVVVAATKKEAQNVLAVMRGVAESLGLTMNPKTTIMPTKSGIDFCGYRAWSTHILPRKKNIIRARRKLTALANMASQDIISAARLPILTKSFLAYAKHCSAYRTTTKILEDINYKGATTCRSTIMC